MLYYKNTNIGVIMTNLNLTQDQVTGIVAEAAAAVFKKHGFEAYANSRLD
jgi:hypothetical protein